MAEEKQFKKGVEIPQLNGAGLRVGIARTRWNASVIDALVSGCREALGQCQVTDIVEVVVPGSYELPLAAKHLIESRQVDAVVCIGCLIKGETMHFEYICEAVTQGIMRLNLDTGVPVIFGVLACLNEEQAMARAGLTPNGHNHGVDWGQTAVEMALLLEKSS
eukprot:TRINITY_DN2049_c0_g1_i2.p1 TRINITY_DN2049_c0_g1~~TRINITY_DN2049_c0_g1_i2.p1  ORF type:complete len:163 (+),score=50.03 TRINITY_DN2049_c0_g1_i2:52-540(+)